MHQIRVHAELLGHPLAGDTQYGRDYEPPAGSPSSPSRLLLHAHSLQITHPSKSQLVRFTAPPPQEYVDEAAALGVPSEALDALRSEGGAKWLE